MVVVLFQFSYIIFLQLLRGDSGLFLTNLPKEDVKRYVSETNFLNIMNLNFLSNTHIFTLE